MSLALNVVRCPDTVAPETRRVSGGEFRLGRGADNDWVLADPERILSKHHCVIAFRQGAWVLADTSTNGTFLNRESEPVGQGQTRVLADGDRVRVGGYEIEVRVDYAAAAPTGMGTGGFGRKPASVFDDPFGDDPLGPPKPAAQPFGGDPLFGPPAEPPRVAMPERFDPLARAEDGFGLAPSTPDHTPSFSDAFRAPPVSPGPPPAPPAGGIPDDWDLDFPAAAPASAPQPFTASPLPGAPPPVAPIVPAGPVARPANPFEESLTPSYAPPPAPPVAPAAAVAEDGLLAAFLDGAAMADAAPKDPVATFRALGAAFRALVAGIRQALIARAAIKGEFRIEQTMIRAQGNNPLKFSAGDEDALAALLGVGRRTDMSAAAAVADALEDMRLHELASMAAMQAAVRQLVARFDPAKLRAQAEAGGGISLLPAQKKARAFEVYETFYGETARALADDFDRVFGREFARAYEQALFDIKSRERR